MKKSNTFVTFIGSRGSGKTTVADELAKNLSDLGRVLFHALRGHKTAKKRLYVHVPPAQAVCALRRGDLQGQRLPMKRCAHVLGQKHRADAPPNGRATLGRYLQILVR